MSKRSWSLRIAAIVAVALGCATSKEQTRPAPIVRTNTVTATAVVKSVDPATRKVTLLGEDGRPFTFVAGNEVRNLDQLAPGDTVRVKYTESLAVSVKPSDGTTAPQVGATGGMERAAPGEKPGGTATSVTSVSAKIVDIDRTRNEVTLVGPEGNYRVLQVQDPKNLENVQVGDMVNATYTESIGISVEPVAPGPTR